MSLRDDDEGHENEAAGAQTRAESGGFSLRHVLASMQSDSEPNPSLYRGLTIRRPATTPNMAPLSHTNLSTTSAASAASAAASSAVPGRFGFSQLGVRHADALRRISEKTSASAAITSASAPAVGECRATSTATARPSSRTTEVPTTTGAAFSPAGGPFAIAGVCNQECRNKLREMARGIEASARRMREAEAAVGEQSRAFQDAKQRLAVVMRQAEAERVGAERLRATIATHKATIAAHEVKLAAHEINFATHESTIAAHESTIATHESTIATHESTIAAHESTIAKHDEEARPVPTNTAEADLAQEVAVAECERQKIALVTAERRINELQQLYDVALAASVLSEKAATAAWEERDAAIAAAHSMQEEMSALRTNVFQPHLGDRDQPEPQPVRGLESLRGITVSEAAVVTGHCLAVGIDVETGIVDVGGEWGEWRGDCNVSHACSTFYSSLHERESSDSSSSDDDDDEVIGAEPAVAADALVGAIIADLKQRMEVKIKARTPVATGL